MIDEAPERMSRFNDREIRRKGKLLMTKVGPSVGGVGGRERDGVELSRLQSARARAGDTNCARKFTPLLYSGIMDPGINETAGGAII